MCVGEHFFWDIPLVGPGCCLAWHHGGSRLMAELVAALSDGRYRIAADGLVAATTALSTQLEGVGIGAGTPVALLANNTLPAALTLLALLQRKVSVVLLPAVARAEREPPLPSFVAFRLALREPSTATTASRTGEVSTGPAATVAKTVAKMSSELPIWPGFLLADWLDVQPRRPQAMLTDGLLLLRTSGSLGAPKLVMHRQSVLWQNAGNALSRLQLAESDRVLIPVPLAHMYGLGAAFLPAVLAGASIELVPAANILRYFEQERRFRPTMSFFSPNLCSMLLRPREATQGYRRVVVAGDKLSPELHAQTQALYGHVVNLYGSTEMGVICTSQPLPGGATPPERVGLPLSGVELRLLPNAAAEPSDVGPPSDVGEIHCAHPQGFVGYIDDDGQPLAQAAPAADGWYATRDLGRQHSDGSLEVLGRCDHATKRDGRLLMLAEVERALCELPSVARAAVILGEPTRRGRALIAFLAGSEGSTLEPTALRRLCQDRLPSFAVPDELRVLASLPLLASGKLDRQALLRMQPLTPVGNQT